jgi:tetratricopeptide (TPR) repeat protein
MGTTVMVAQPFYWGKAMAGVPIGKLAPEVTVFIQGVNNPDNFGSGVIIGHSGKSYTVLTAAHVVAAADRYTIQASDGVQYSLQNIQRLPNVDMAVVQFESSSSYTTAQLGDSDQVSLTTGVYVAGFPKPGQNIRVPVLTITNGEIAQVLPANASVDGYGLAYTNSTRAGMSGGPVFNAEGQVVAIHGRKEGEAGGGSTNGAWLNLGIPINRYKTAKTGGSQIARTSFVDTQQQNAREEAQQKAQEQSRLAQEKAAQQQAALEAQRKAQEQAQRQAALEAQKKNQEQVQRQAALEAQKKNQEQVQRQAALEAQKKNQEQAQRQAALEAQKKNQEQAQRKAALEVQKKNQTQATAQQQSKGATAKALLAASSPFAAATSQPQTATAPSSRQVCEEIRINTIVSKRCRTESVFQESASASKSGSNPENYVNNGNARAASGSYQSAVEDYNAAIQSNSSLAIAFFNRGLAYYRLGQTQRAIADFSKAADLFKSQGDAQKLQKTQDILQSLTQANS